MSLLETVNTPADIKQLTIEQLNELAAEIRTFIVDNVTVTGGHLASNLGIVEITLAMYYVFDFPNDKLVWDVGHQSYVHKIITGRRESFATLRTKEGISGFPQRSESEYDQFDTGHSSTALSACVGFAAARDLKKEQYEIVALIGDGAFAGGMTFEAINNLGDLKSKVIVVLNDNEMSISKNTGMYSRSLYKLRTNKKYERFKSGIERMLGKDSKASRFTKHVKDVIRYMFIPGQFFDELGLKYLGLVDGHNIEELIAKFKQAKEEQYTCVVHTVTQKGKGYEKAENDPEKYHGVAPFVVETPEEEQESSVGFSALAGEYLTQMADADDKIVALSAAMMTGTGMQSFAEKYPDRAFDVGICEQHAVTMAAAMSIEGLKPYFAVYSTFAQRCYDQMLEDVCLQKCNVTMLVDRAGLNGEDGKTHQGIYDVALWRTMPYLTVMAPSNETELKEMMLLSAEHDGPCVIRYPKSCVPSKSEHKSVEYGKWTQSVVGQNVAIVTFGAMMSVAEKLIEPLHTEGIYPTLVNARFIKPLDEDMLVSLQRHRNIIVIEDNIVSGGLGAAIEEFYSAREIKGVQISIFGVRDEAVEHATVGQQREIMGLTAEQLLEQIIRLNGEKKK